MSDTLKVVRPNRTLSQANREAVKTYKKATKTPVSREEKVHEEVVGFTQSFQITLGGDTEYDELYENPDTLLENCRDGVLLAKIINCVTENTVDMKKVNKTINLKNLGKSGSKDVHLVNENLNYVIKGARNLGAKIVNTGAEDILGKNEDITLGLIWQIVRMNLVKDVNLLSHPELIRLLHENEQLTDLIALTPEQLLLRWLNHHLMRAGLETRVKNFHTDLKDSKIYSIILERIAPRLINKEALEKAMASEDEGVRAVEIINQVNLIGCETFVRPVNIISGHNKFNTALVATMFNTHIGIHLPSEDELDQLFAKLEMQTKEIAELKEKLREALLRVDSLGASNTDLKRDMEEKVKSLEMQITTLTAQNAQAAAAATKAQEKLVQAHDKDIEALKKKASQVKKDFKAKLANANANAEKERLAKIAAMSGAEQSAEAAEELRKAEEAAKEAERLAKEEEQQQKEALQARLDETLAALKEMEQHFEDTTAKLAKETAAKENEQRLKESAMETLASTKDTLATTTTSLMQQRSCLNSIDIDIDEIGKQIEQGLGATLEDMDGAKGTMRLKKLVDQLLKCNKENERKKHEALSKYAAEQTKNEVILTKVQEQVLLKVDTDRRNLEEEQAKKKGFFGARPSKTPPTPRKF